MKKLQKIIKAKIIAMYYGGSRGYGLANEQSDNEIMVIIEKGMDFSVYHFEDKEYFILSKEYFDRINEIDDETNDFVAVHADVILGCRNEENIIYVDDNYKDEFLALVTTPWGKAKLKKFLLRFVAFFVLHTGLPVNVKKSYHILRVKAMLDHYILTGVFSLVYEEPMRSEIIKYKRDFETLDNIDSRLIELLNFIQDYANEMEEV